MRLHLPRVGTCFVAGVYLFTNVAATHAVEKSLWEDRRDALGRAPRYAQLSSDAHTPLPWNQPGFAAGLSSVQPRSTLKKLSVPFDAASVVLPFGAIGEVRSGRLGAPVVFLVQDVHGNDGAQKNIGGLLGELSAQGLTLTGVEGAWVPIDLSAYHQHPSPEAVSLVADALRSSGRLSGSEWAGLTAAHPPTLVGVESPELYHANVTAARECVARRPIVAPFLVAVNKTLQAQKGLTYSPALKDFDLHLTEYRNGREGLAVYARTLSGLPGADAQAGAQVKMFLKAMEWESRLNFGAIEGERRALMDRLAQKLDHRALEALLAQAVAYRAGKQTNGDFFSYLKTLCAKTKIPFNSYRSFADYISYVGLVQSIRRADLLEELDVWETTLGDRLAQTPQEHRLLAIDRDASLLRQLLENEMSPEAWALFAKRRQDIVSLPERLREFGDFQEPPEGLAALLQPHEEFCRLAMERNGVMAANFAHQVETRGANKAVLVAGGFHTPGLQSELLKRGYSTVVVTPRIEKVEGKPLDVFARDPLPFDQLFAGKPISLSPELLAGQESGRSFLDLIITAEALILTSPESGSAGRAREWASRQGLHIKYEDHNPPGLVRVLINLRGSGVRLSAGPKSVVEKTLTSDEPIEKVGLSNGQVVWVSPSLPRTGIKILVRRLMGRIFLSFKEVIEKMATRRPNLFSHEEGGGLVGKMLHRVFPLLSFRLSIVPPASTVLPNSSGLFLAEPYLRYNRLVRRIVNPRGGAYRLLYGGAEADLSNGLLLSHFTRAFFVSPTHGLTISDLIRIKKQEVREDPLYAQEKHDDGFSDGSRLNGKEKLLSSLSLELKGMSVPFESLEVFDWNGRPGLRFLWKAPGESSPTVREIIFVDADITQPAQYKDVLMERFDLYLQRAGMLIPWAYRDRNSFIKVIAGSLNPGAYFATDDDALGEPGEFVDQSRFFPLDLPEIPIPGDQELLSQVIALRYKRAGLRAWANRQREGYGFLLRIRQMSGDPLAAALEDHVDPLEKLLKTNNKYEIAISLEGMNHSLVMRDDQGQAIGRAVFFGKRGEITITGVEVPSPENGVPVALLLEVARFGLLEGGEGRVLIRGTNNKEIVQAAHSLFDPTSFQVAAHQFDRSVKNTAWTNPVSFSDGTFFERIKDPSQSFDVAGSLSLSARAELWPERFHLRGELRPEIDELAQREYMKFPSSNHFLMVGIGFPVESLIGIVLAVVLIGVFLYRDKILGWVTSIKAPPWLLKGIFTDIPHTSKSRSSFSRVNRGPEPPFHKELSLSAALSLGFEESFLGKTVRRVFPGLSLQQAIVPISSNGLTNGSPSPQDDGGLLDALDFKNIEETYAFLGRYFGLHGVAVDVGSSSVDGPAKGLRREGVENVFLVDHLHRTRSESSPGIISAPGDATALSEYIGKESMDVVLFHRSLHHIVADKETRDSQFGRYLVAQGESPDADITFHLDMLSHVLEEAKKSLKPGGRLLIYFAPETFRLPGPPALFGWNLEDMLQEKGFQEVRVWKSERGTVLLSGVRPKSLSENSLAGIPRLTRGHRQHGTEQNFPSLVNGSFRSTEILELAQKIKLAAFFRPQGQNFFVQPTVDGGPEPTGESRLVPGIRVNHRLVTDTLNPSDRAALGEALIALAPAAFEMRGVVAEVDPHQLVREKRSVDELRRLLTKKIQLAAFFRPQGQNFFVQPTVDGGPEPTGESRLKVNGQPSSYQIPEEIINGIIQQDSSSLLWMGLFSSNPLGIRALAGRVVMAAQSGDANAAGASLAAWDDSKYLAGPNPAIVAETLAVLISLSSSPPADVAISFAESYNRVRAGLLFPKLVGGQLSKAGIVLNLSPLFDQHAQRLIKNQTWLALAASLAALERDPNTPLALVVNGKNVSVKRVQEALLKDVPGWGKDVFQKAHFFVESEDENAPFFVNGKFSLSALRGKAVWQRPLTVMGFSEESILNDSAWPVEFVPLNANLNADLQRILGLLRFIQINS